jgi:hypothetical protein
MRSANDASEAARRLAELRWSPEARLRHAVETVIERSSQLDDSQRAAIEAAITEEARDEC